MDKWLSIGIIIFCSLMLCTDSAYAANRTFTVVLDPGHGGKDDGARGEFSFEKDICLRVSKEVYRILGRTNPDVRVKLTRNDDSFVGLVDRATFAHQLKADLFLSIHANSMDASTSFRDKVRGCVAYIVGNEASNQNMSIAQRENAAIELEENHYANYHGFEEDRAEMYIMSELLQKRHRQQSIDFAQQVLQEMTTVAHRLSGGVHQAGFLVLSRATMPAVLVELDYITNPACEAFMNSDDGCSQMAQAIANAIVKYKHLNSK